MKPFLMFALGCCVGIHFTAGLVYHAGDEKKSAFYEFACAILFVALSAAILWG